VFQYSTLLTTELQCYIPYCSVINCARGRGRVSVRYVRFQAFTVRAAQMTVLWVTTPCTITGWFRRFESTWFLDLQSGWIRLRRLPTWLSHFELSWLGISFIHSALSVDLIEDNYCKPIHIIDPFSRPNHSKIQRDLIQSPWRWKQNVPPKCHYQPVVAQNMIICVSVVVFSIKQPLTSIRLL
jgi:hypothetical protein